MTKLICLVVAIGLVSVQGTSIIRHVMSDDLERNAENDHTNFDGRSAMLTGLIRNNLRNIGALENGILENIGTPSFKCVNSFCQFCEYGFCLSVTYDSESDIFHVKGTFLNGYVFSSKIHVRPWRDCETINTAILSVDACVTLSRVKIMNGRICADINVEAGFLLEKNFSAICI